MMSENVSSVSHRPQGGDYGNNIVQNGDGLEELEREDDDKDDEEVKPIVRVHGDCISYSECQDQLSDFHRFLISKPRMDPNVAQTIFNRMTKLVLWTAKKAGPVFTLTGGTIDLIAWIRVLLIERCHLIREFTEDLGNCAGIAPETIRHYCLNMNSFLAWFRGIDLPVSERRCTLDELAEVLELLATLKRECRTDSRHRGSKNCTVKALTQARKLIPGGLKKLQELVANGIAWALDNESSLLLAVDSTNHDSLLSVMFAGMYVHTAQGRIAALGDLRFDQADELLNDGYTLSTKFKTRHKYGYQPVILPTAIKPLFQLYLRVRMAIENNHGPCDVLFLNVSGEPVVDASKRLIKYFNLTGWHITSTMCRSMVEMETYNAHVHGLLNDTHVDAHRHINGHSSQTTMDFYLRDDAERSVRLGNDAFSAMMAVQPGGHIVHANDNDHNDDNVFIADTDNMLFATTADVAHSPQYTDSRNDSPVASVIAVHQPRYPATTAAAHSPQYTDSRSDTPVASVIAVHQPRYPATTAAAHCPTQQPMPSGYTSAYTQYPAVPWGKPTAEHEGHPAYEEIPTSLRAVWSSAEIHYIGWWYENFSCGNNVQLAKRCLAYLLAHSDAWPVFHVNHTLNSARLRTGLETFLERRREI